MDGPEPTIRRILLAAGVALTVGLGIITVAVGFNQNELVRLLQGIAIFGLGAAIVGGMVAFALVRLADWRDPASEDEFDALVERSERLAASGSWGGVEDGGGDDDADALEDLFGIEREEDFRALVRAAVDELPLEFHRALEHVAIVISDGGAKRRAYGLYQGDTVANDYFHDRIIIFRDTLIRDFGHDPELLQAQVTRVVRHELAHHLGWDEKGVRGLGL